MSFELWHAELSGPFGLSGLFGLSESQATPAPVLSNDRGAQFSRGENHE